jgi:hypothetical protein
MLRRLLWCALAALALAPTALADGGSVGVTQGWDGVAAPNGNVRYVTLPAGADTALAAIRTHGGRVESFASLPGSWGIPSITLNGATGGLSVDGRTLVLGDASAQGYPRRESTFLVIDSKTLRTRTFVRLRGDFAFDALSPDARMLYLIQHVSAVDLTHYVVRAYDLEHGRLLQGAIADKAQRGWVMAGYPLTRLTSAGGRMVYTLYRHDGGYPFIHALDTVTATAHCIGVPWRGSQDRLWELRLSLRDGGQRLTLGRQHGKSFLSVDTRTYRLARPATAGASFPWWAVAIGATVLVAGLVRPAVRRSRTDGAVPRANSA